MAEINSSRGYYSNTVGWNWTNSLHNSNVTALPLSYMCTGQALGSKVVWGVKYLYTSGLSAYMYNIIVKAIGDSMSSLGCLKDSHDELIILHLHCTLSL